MGTWRLHGSSELFEPLRPELTDLAQQARRERGARTVGPLRTYLKASALRPWPALRHATRRVLGLGLPRWNEYRNLAWLRARGFQAPRPLVAGVWFRAGLPRYQFLLSEIVDAPTLAEVLAPGRSTPEERRARIEALARDLARLHGSGFVHRDAFPRNLLACGTAQAPTSGFLDCWRGGPGPGWRGPDHDLGCFLLDGAALLDPGEQACFLGTYREESERIGRGLAWDWPRAVEKARARVHRREATRRPGLPASWSCPRLPDTGPR